MSGLSPTHMKAGGAFPDLDLPDHTGRLRRLSELAGGDPVALFTSRGWWCPKEQRYMRGLCRLQDEFEVAYARIVVVSVDPPEVQSAFWAGLGARFTFLSDSERRWLPRLGLLETTDTLHDPYLPAAFTLTPDLQVHRAYNGYWYFGRPTLEELRCDMREITMAVRGLGAARSVTPFVFVVFDGRSLSLDPRAPGRGLRIDPRCIDGEPVRGAFAHVCALPDKAAALRYDEPELQQARRDTLAWWIPMLGDELVCLSTFALDASRCAGAVTVARSPALFADDPFLRLFPGTVVATDVFCAVASPPGPPIERYAGAPWPGGGF